jgi:hypothetical protein
MVRDSAEAMDFIVSYAGVGVRGYGLDLCDVPLTSLGVYGKRCIDEGLKVCSVSLANVAINAISRSSATVPR